MRYEPFPVGMGMVVLVQSSTADTSKSMIYLHFLWNIANRLR
jgi:hypothetical protein